MWKGRIGNDRQGFKTLADKLSVIERSNNQKIVGVYINPQEEWWNYERAKWSAPLNSETLLAYKEAEEKTMGESLREGGPEEER